MKIHRIKGLVFRYLYIYPRSMPRLLDLFLWPILELLLWGFLSLYLEHNNLADVNIASILLGAIIFWTFLNRSQEAVTVSFLEDVWERNLLNIFVTPVKVSEFIGASLCIGLVRIALHGVILGVVALLLYHFDIFQYGLYTIPFVLNLLVFGWTLGLFVLAIILRFGSSAQVLAFTFTLLIQPFSAVFYSVSILPEWIRWLAYVFPSTYVFEGMREVLHSGTVSTSNIVLASVTNIVYLIIVIWFFYRMFGWVKKNGALLKFD